MKPYLLTFLAALSLSSCDFGSKSEQNLPIEVPDAIPSYVDYEVERLVGQKGPCATDSLSSQCLEYSVEYPKINGKVPAAVIEKINENIKFNIFEYAFISDKPDSFESLISELSTAYEDVLKDLPEYKASWSMEVNSDIIYQDSAFISVASTIYSYTGGAHPNAYQVYRSYDLATGDPIQLSDILSVGYERELNDAAEIEFRMLKEIPPSQALKVKGYYFENGKFELNDNFAIINKSLIFYFNPFEIAPYAVGPTELELKLTDYVKLIKDTGVLHAYKN
ncbi:DUF3298 and DUF4163 domain-containing protein [Roseivirga misakiensis]|uniref:DUF3298 domain-containing protein n=1 Tax=Roseivirga misakiensis TaxID=1563681 RepID=A0A1E5T6M0_9BACT|nr:DUF3298 and DUF4163 domain-containing protein [Roseivirga misakiensis]OEK06947.1 hypothetical protein BFP71_04635 [Roseivirga misakiensis]